MTTTEWFYRNHAEDVSLQSFLFEHLSTVIESDFCSGLRYMPCKMSSSGSSRHSIVGSLHAILALFFSLSGALKNFKSF